MESICGRVHSIGELLAGWGERIVFVELLLVLVGSALVGVAIAIATTWDFVCDPSDPHRRHTLDG